MASAEESASKSETKQLPAVSVHKVKVVSPFIQSDSGTSSCQDNKEQEVSYIFIPLIIYLTHSSITVVPSYGKYLSP